MSRLTWSRQPGAVDLPDLNLTADKPITDASLIVISSNATFGAVRPETFQGWYRNGEMVALPVNPVDGNHYTRQKL